MKKIALSFMFCLVFSLGCLVGCNDKFDLDKFTKNLSTYSMDITYNEDNTVNVKQTINYTNNTGVKLDNIKLHIYVRDFEENRSETSIVSSLNFDKAYYSGVSYSKINFSKILVNDKECNHSFENTDENILNIVFDNKLNVNDKITLYFEYVIIMPNINHRFGVGENTINVSNFYPVISVYENGEYDMDSYHSNGDPFYSDFANYFVCVTVPKKYTLASSGDVTNMVTNDSTTTYEITGYGIRDFAFTMSDKFKVVSKDLGDTTINYYYYNNTFPEKCLDTSVKAVTTFEDLFGDYPYKTLNVCEASFVHGGMEYPNLVYISDSVVDEVDYLNVIVHEIAHQWWYGMVGNDEYKYGWLDEGLTEYSTLLFYERNLEFGVDTSLLIKNQTNSYVTFIEVYKNVFDSVDTSMNRALDEFDTEYEYVYVAYVKGMLFFNDLRGLMGDTKFFTALKDYFDDNKFSFATPDTLLASFEKSSKMSLSDYFASWINGNVEIISVN